MANFLDPSALPAYIDQDVNRFILLPLFSGNGNVERYTVRLDVKSETAVQRFGAINKITKKAVKGFNALGTSQVDDRTVAPKRVKAEQAEDGYNLEGKILEQWLNLSQDEKDNLDGTRLKELLLGIHGNGVENDLVRQLWFADTASVSADYDVYEGIFKRYSTNLPAGQKLVGPIGALAADAAEGLFRNVWAAATNELKNSTGHIMEVSGSIWDNWTETLEDRGTEQADVRLVNGVETGKWRGIDVVIHREWDTYAVDDLAFVDPHRIVFHQPKAVLIGTDLKGTENTKFWFNRDEEEYRFRTSYVLDTQTMDDNLAVTLISA